MKGTIKRLSDKAYGFITVDGTGKDVFFHANDVEEVSFDSLREGQQVTFEMGESPKGPKAVEVKKI